MKRLLLVSLGALALGLAVASTANAAADYYLKLDGIDGESASTGHEGSLAVESFSFGATQMGAINEQDQAFVALHKELRDRATELGERRGLPEDVVHQVLA